MTMPLDEQLTMVNAQGSPSIDSGVQNRELLVEVLVATALLAVTTFAYVVLFNRANVLSHSIGYNLYASERVLDGAVPYRDFHTLYPPATFYLNALLFNWLGVSLHTALLGVMVFKILTVLAIYLSGREIMPRTWAFTAALSSLLWLRPNGPFKSVPMHYGTLFLALGMYLILRHQNRKPVKSLFLAGLSLGLVALFKHNIGAYALVGSFLYLAYDSVAEREPLLNTPDDFNKSKSSRLKIVIRRSCRPLFALAAGFTMVVVPVLAFMQANSALRPMIQTMLFGPGEFLLSRLAVPLSPVAPLVLLTALAGIGYFASKLRKHTAITICLWITLLVGVLFFLIRGSIADVNQVIFYFPMLVLGFSLLIAVSSIGAASGVRGTLLVVLIFSASALMELFPRFAREQSIAAMPFVMLVVFYLLYLLRPLIAILAGGVWQTRLALAIIPVIFTVIECRLFYNTYFESSLRFRASTSVNIERGRGTFFPATTASLIDNAVSYIQEKVDPEGNAFAQSDAGTSLLFLANRRNVSNAQFWIGVGVTQAERAATLDRIDKSRTKLIITSDEVLAAEKYEPMREYIERNFEPTVRLDEVLMLERRTN